MRIHRLQVYLNDHLALIREELELLRQCRLSHQEEPVDARLARIESEVEEQFQALREVLNSIEESGDGKGRNPAWFSRKRSRFELNAALIDASPLSRLVELEALAAAAHERIALWEALEMICADEPRLLRVTWKTFREKSQRHLEILEAERRSTTRKVFAEAS